jgi:hypothetical protein
MNVGIGFRVAPKPTVSLRPCPAFRLSDRLKTEKAADGARIQKVGFRLHQELDNQDPNH